MFYFFLNRVKKQSILNNVKKQGKMIMCDSFFMRSKTHRICYDFHLGSKQKCIVFLHGLLSSHKSVKAQCVRHFAVQNGFSFLSLDYTAHGASSGQPSDFRVGHCFKDALEIINNILPPRLPLILVGSSLGGWIALLLAQHLKKRVSALIGLSAAPDFTERVWQDVFTDKERAFLNAGGILGPSSETRGYCFKKEMFLEAEKYLLLNRRIDYNGRVVLIHGDQDQIVPVSIPFKIKNALDSDNVEIHFINGAGHTLSRPSDLDEICFVLNNMIKEESL